MKFVKRNALAGRDFDTFASLYAYLAGWMREADERVHAMTRSKPCEPFERDEKGALRPPTLRLFPRRQQMLRRKVANDALVNIDTRRYSVPHRLVRECVEVQPGDEEVRIFPAGQLVASHRRSTEPYSRVVDQEHRAGLWRFAPEPECSQSQLVALGRSLEANAAVVERGAA